MSPEDEYLIEIGKNIKRLRLAKGLTQVDLAHRCDIEKQNMNRIEAGKNNLTIKSLLKISAALDVNLPELFPFNK
jgi:transcriptional regulator with XRE-family HTH domain